MDQLRARYQKDKIYTYVGDILVAVNPYRPLALYDSKVISVYIGLYCVNKLMFHSFNLCMAASGLSNSSVSSNWRLLLR